MSSTIKVTGALKANIMRTLKMHLNDPTTIAHVAALIELNQVALEQMIVEEVSPSKTAIIVPMDGDQLMMIQGALLIFRGLLKDEETRKQLGNMDFTGTESTGFGDYLKRMTKPSSN